ncbi:MAG: hypothetical protein GDA37_07595 [Ekhidna sp.]|nr:hypothetical protein [Ekhidna sp.]
MKKATNSIDLRWASIFEQVKANAHVSDDGISLPVVRILIGTYMLCFGTTSWTWIAQFPDSFHRPHVFNIVGQIISEFPSYEVLIVLEWMYIFSLVAIITGVKPRIFSLAAFALQIFLHGVAFSFGKIDHAILLTFLFFVLSKTNAGCKLAIYPAKPFPIDKQDTYTGVFAFIICFGLFSSGFPKALMWIDFDTRTSGILRWYYEGYYSLNRRELLAPYFVYVPTYLVELMDYIVPLFEMSGFIFLLRSKRHWRLWLWLLGLFHLSNLLILNISFKQYLIVYGFFLFPSVLLLFKRNNYLLVLFLICISIVVVFRLNILLTGFGRFVPGLFESSHIADIMHWICFLLFGSFYIIRVFIPSKN